MKKLLKLTLLSAALITSTSNLCLATEVFFRGTITYFDPDEGHEVTKKFGIDRHTPRITLDIDLHHISQSELKEKVSTAAEIPTDMFRIIMKGKDMEKLSQKEFNNALQPKTTYNLTGAKK